MDRIIGEVTGDGKEQLLIAIGAMHGNELSGVLAAERVLDILSNPEKNIKGKFLALRGNVAALEVKRRFIDIDLNRIWTAEDIQHPKNEKGQWKTSEHKELTELHQMINHEINQGYKNVVIIDLHTTSANGGVFIGCTDEEIHKQIVRRLHVPVILNLAKDLKGTAMQYYWEQNCVAFAFEGGNHYNPESANKMESALWLCLEHMGMINRRIFNNIEFHDKRLINSTAELPHFCMLTYHHAISAEDEFEMLPGFINFQKVQKGQHLANDRKGKVYCPLDGRILMPLYQAQGTDGFFLVEELN